LVVSVPDATLLVKVVAPFKVVVPVTVAKMAPPPPVEELLLKAVPPLYVLVPPV
jgi:hypothetical protein